MELPQLMRRIRRRTPDGAEPPPDTDPDNPPDTDDDTDTDAEAGVRRRMVRGGARMPAWWSTKRPALHDPDPDPDPDPGLGAGLDVDPDLDVDAAEPDEMDTGEWDVWDTDEGRAKRSYPTRRSMRIYRRPAYRANKPTPRQSLLRWWLGLGAATRWFLYNGTATAIGWYMHVPQFFTAETAYLVHTYGSWAAWQVCIWYGIAIALWVGDYRTRAWWPPLALICRIPLVSMVVGVLLYGSPDVPD